MPIFFWIIMFYGTFADCSVPYSFRFSETEHYLRHYLSQKEETTCNTTVSVTEQEFLDWAAAGNTIDSFAEFCLLCEQTSEYLLYRDRCIFHSVALSFDGYAWLLMAGSGVGKSTLCRAMIEKYPDELSIINGDKPVLMADSNGGITVYPSPWNGKEGWHGAQAAPLGGIILLRRGIETTIKKVNNHIAAPYVFLNIFQSFAEKNIIIAAGEMAEKILRAAPIWALTEDDVSGAAELLYRTIKETRSHDI